MFIPPIPPPKPAHVRPHKPRPWQSLDAFLETQELERDCGLSHSEAMHWLKDCEADK